MSTMLFSWKLYIVSREGLLSSKEAGPQTQTSILYSITCKNFKILISFIWICAFWLKSPFSPQNMAKDYTIFMLSKCFFGKYFSDCDIFYISWNLDFWKQKILRKIFNYIKHSLIFLLQALNNTKHGNLLERFAWKNFPNPHLH